MTFLYIVLGLCVFTSVMLVFWLYSYLRRDAMTTRERIMAYGPKSVHASFKAITADRRRRAEVAAQLAQNAKLLRARWGFKDTPKLKQDLMAAGLGSQIFIELFLASRFVLAAGAAGIVLSFTHQVIPVVGFAAGGWITPDYILHYLVSRRKSAIRLALPNMVDLLIICIDAGSGIEQSIQRVTSELQYMAPALYEELQIVIQKQNLGETRVDAWRNFAQRTDCDEVRGFVSMLEQTERYGTPIARALRTYADLLRLQRRQDAEKRAAKVPVKMLFPLVLFIFPCIFVVLVGPPVIRFMTGQFQISQVQPVITQHQEETQQCCLTQYETSQFPSSSSFSPFSSYAGGPGQRRGNV